MTHVAHVGAFKRMSTSDTTRWLMAVTWLLDHHKLPGDIRHESINLKYGRDFLAEYEKYDIVVMHDIFWGSALLKDVFRGRSRADRDRVRTSPLQSEAAWVARLATSGAQHIFIFETSPACVNGWKLGDLPGYVIRHQDTDVTVYERTGP